MHLSFYKEITLRQPFQVKSLPLSAKIYSKSYGRPTNRFQKFAVRPLAKKLYKLLGKTGTGTFIFTSQERVISISFRAGNTQFHSIYLPEYRYFEPETLALTDTLLSGEHVFYDIGSNWGHFSLHAVSNPDFKGTVYAFEPMPSTYEDLIHTVNEVSLRSRIYTHNFTLSDKNGEAFIHIPDGIHSGNATLSSPGKKGQKVVLKKLDGLELAPPYLMKIDAEGHEAEIFTGAKNTIEKHLPYLIFENSKNTQTPGQMLNPLFILEKLGYLFFIPLFIEKKENIWVYSNRQGYIPSTEPYATLGLFEFKPEERCFLDEQINIFACHNSKVKELGERLISLSISTPKGTIIEHIN